MFKSFFQRLLGGRGKVVRAAPVPARHSASAPAAAAARSMVQEASVRPRIERGAPPEHLCGLTPGMTPEEIRDRLALLYRRHNRAASSLDAELREEAEIMLDAVVRCRETFLGMPKADPDPPVRST